MDNLAKRLRQDAANINVEVSTQLDDRIRASLEGITPERPDVEQPAPRTRSMWWASSLTGVAAAAVVFAVINLREPEVPPVVAGPNASVAEQGPMLWSLRPYLNIENAVSASPLRQELEDLEADLKKAEEAVRKDIGLVEISD